MNFLDAWGLERVSDITFSPDLFDMNRPAPFSGWGVYPGLEPKSPTDSTNITSEYGPEHPLGIDIGGTTQGVKGDSIKASVGGTVTTAGVPKWSDSRSPYVVVKGDDGREYRYAHLDVAITIFEGQRVEQGQLLGFMSDNGSEKTGVHLHFEVRVANKPVNPTEIVK